MSKEYTREDINALDQSEVVDVIINTVNEIATENPQLAQTIIENVKNMQVALGDISNVHPGATAIVQYFLSIIQGMQDQIAMLAQSPDGDDETERFCGIVFQMLVNFGFALSYLNMLAASNMSEEDKEHARKIIAELDNAASPTIH